MSVKIAELTNGKVICGNYENDFWKQVFAIYLVKTPNNQTGINFAPLIAFGDFDQVIEIKESKYIYIYSPDIDFVNLYNQHVTKFKAAQSGIILPNSTNVTNVTKPKNGKVVKLR